MTKKAENYTPEMTATIINAYTSADSDESRKNTVAAMAEKFGKTVASVRMKLVREGVYVKATATDKNCKEITKKGELVTKIANRCNVRPELFDSLEKANKAVLEAILNRLSELENNVLALEHTLKNET